MNTQRHTFRKTQLAGNVGAPGATRLNQFLRNVLAVFQNAAERFEPIHQADLRPGVAQDKAQHLRQAAINPLEIAFEA